METYLEIRKLGFTSYTPGRIRKSLGVSVSLVDGATTLVIGHNPSDAAVQAAVMGFGLGLTNRVTSMGTWEPAYKQIKEKARTALEGETWRIALQVPATLGRRSSK